MALAPRARVDHGRAAAGSNTFPTPGSPCSDTGIAMRGNGDLSDWSSSASQPCDDADDDGRVGNPNTPEEGIPESDVIAVLLHYHYRCKRARALEFLQANNGDVTAAVAALEASTRTGPQATHATWMRGGRKPHGTRSIGHRLARPGRTDAWGSTRGCAGPDCEYLGPLRGTRCTNRRATARTTARTRTRGARNETPSSRCARRAGGPGSFDR